MNDNPPKELINLGKRIAYLRAKNSYTQESLAELVHYSTNHISKLESARTNPSFDLLIKLSQVFNIEIKELFNFDDYCDINYLKDKMHSIVENSDEKFLKTIYKIQENIRS